MRLKSLARWWSVAAVVFALSALIGGPLLAKNFQLLDPVMKGTIEMARPFLDKGALLAFFLFCKNLFVAVLALFWGQAMEAIHNTVKNFLTKLRVPEKLLRLATWYPSWADKVVPLVILIVNGAVIAGVCTSLHHSGTSGAELLAGLLPHGIPELSALFLACGAGVIGSSLCEKVDLFTKTVIPLLLIAATIETWVTPLVMAAVS